MRENQGVRIVEMFSCGTIQIVKFLLAGDAQRHDLGPHAAHEVHTDSATGVAGRVKLGVRSQPTTAGSRSRAHPPHRAADTPTRPARRPAPSRRTSPRPEACGAPPADSRLPPPSHPCGGRRSPARVRPSCHPHRSSAARTAGTRCPPRTDRNPDAAGDRVPTRTQTPHGRRLWLTTTSPILSGSALERERNGGCMCRSGTVFHDGSVGNTCGSSRRAD
jgi:hypothetical protein